MRAVTIYVARTTVGARPPSRATRARSSRRPERRLCRARAGWLRHIAANVEPRRLSVSAPENRGNVNRAVPSPDEPTQGRRRPAPAVPGVGLTRGPLQLDSFGMTGTLGRLARLVSGVAERIGAGQVDAYELATKEAFHSAVIQGSAEPLAPAGLAPATAPRAKPERRSGPADQGQSATAPLTPAPLAAAAQLAAPAIASASSAAAEPPAERAAASGSAEPPAPSALPRRRSLRDRARLPVSAPTSVTPMADDFFDGLIRQVKSDR